MVKLRGLDVGSIQTAKSIEESFIKVKPAGKEHSSRLMDPTILGNGLMTSSTGMVKRVRQEAQPTKGSTSMGKSKARGSSP